MHQGNHCYQCTEYRNVSLSLLTESKTNPRRSFEHNSLHELAKTIQTHGVLSPLLVRPLTEHGFEIAFGARRFRAAHIVEIETVPVRIKNMTDAEVIEPVEWDLTLGIYSSGEFGKGRPPVPKRPLSDVIAMPYSGNKLHPTQKPVTALFPLIRTFTVQGELVLDPFAGSGSTCATAMLANRRFIGIELDEVYCEAATARVARV